MIGKTTIDNQNVNESRGQTGSYSLQNQVLGRDLIDPAEIARLNRSECLVLITGLPPFKSKKYHTAKHPRYKHIADGGKPLFDIRDYKRRSDDGFLKNAIVLETADISELNALV
jgi:type IV secretion system protein VirD4